MKNKLFAAFLLVLLPLTISLDIYGAGDKKVIHEPTNAEYIEKVIWKLMMDIVNKNYAGIIDVISEKGVHGADSRVSKDVVAKGIMDKGWAHEEFFGPSLQSLIDECEKKTKPSAWVTAFEFYHKYEGKIKMEYDIDEFGISAWAIPIGRLLKIKTKITTDKTPYL